MKLKKDLSNWHEFGDYWRKELKDIKRKEKKMKVLNTLKTIWNWLEGKKTYITAIIVAVLALLTASGVVIPEYVWIILSALGLGSLRASVPKK